jgi:hypothetical protein
MAISKNAIDEVQKGIARKPVPTGEHLVGAKLGHGHHPWLGTWHR